MSYAAYVAAGEDPKVLLNRTFLLEQTQRIFTRFFQHYVSSEINHVNGSWAYQPIGATLNDIGPVANAYVSQQDFKSPTGYRQLNTNHTATAILSTHVEILEMDPAATWLSIAILIYLCLVTLVLAATQRYYVGSLGIKVKCIADILALITRSEELMRLIREEGVDALKKLDIYVKLNPFRGKDGRVYYAIEILDPPANNHADGLRGYELSLLHRRSQHQA
jgi:hypothetical protein